MRTFEQLCQENYRRIYNYVNAMIRDTQGAEDLTQEVFLLAYKKGTVFLSHEKPAAFLYKTAKLKVLEYIRVSGKQKLLELNDDLVGEDGDVLQVLLRDRDRETDEWALVPMVLSKLNGEQKDLYRLYYVEKRTMREIAREKGLQEAALRMRYVRLRKEVKRIVRELNIGEGGSLI